MVDANVKIIEDLRQFLDSVIMNPLVRKYFTSSPSDFIRTRKLPLQKIVGLLINLPKRSLSIELQSFFDSIGASDLSCTKGAFSLQRTKLNPLFFTYWNQLLVQHFYSYYGNHVKRWEGYILLAVDGSNMHLMDVAEVVNYFGTADNKYGGVPMARAIQIHDVLNDLTVWSDIFPRSQSENVVISNRIHNLSPDSITLFDRGYPSYSLIYQLSAEEEPRHFVMRCKLTFSKEVNSFVQSKKKSMTTILFPTDHAIVKLKECGFIVRKNTGLKIRMVKVELPTGEIEVLLTNLFDEKKFTVQKLGELYFMRWKIETAFSKQKNQLQMEIFSGHRVVCIEQDYAAGIFVANLQSLIEKQCDHEVNEISVRRKHAYKINKNASWASLKNRILQLFIQPVDSCTILIELQKLLIKNIEPVRPGRQYKREKEKRKRGKYQTFTNYRRAI